MKKIIAFVTAPLRWAFKSSKVGINISEQAQIKRCTTESKKQIKAYYSELASNRDPWAENAPDMTQFDQVLKHWQIEPGEVPNVIRGMCIQTILFGFIGGWGGWLVCTSSAPFIRIQGFFLIAIAVVVGFCRFWRIQILYNQKFVFFKDWFLWGAFSWTGKESPISQNKRQLRRKDRDG
jgi:hypothetical protein